MHNSAPMNHLIPVGSPDLLIITKKKRICKIVDFAVGPRNKSEETKKDKYLDLARDLKKLWIGALGTLNKNY